VLAVNTHCPLFWFLGRGKVKYNPALQALVRANQRTLLTIAEQPQLAVDYIATFLGPADP